MQIVSVDIGSTWTKAALFTRLSLIQGVFNVYISGQRYASSFKA